MLKRYQIADVDDIVVPTPPTFTPARIEVLADGMTAARAIAASASETTPSTVCDHWIADPVEASLERFFAKAPGSGVLVGAGEAPVVVENRGRGGRCTHAALLAARELAGTDWLFAAVASDGSDGSSGKAGACVDGETIQRGGPGADDALAAFDSVRYLEDSGDTVELGHTGTNVADLWVLWKP